MLSAPFTDGCEDLGMADKAHDEVQGTCAGALTEGGSTHP